RGSRVGSDRRARGGEGRVRARASRRGRASRRRCGRRRGGARTDGGRRDAALARRPHRGLCRRQGRARSKARAAARATVEAVMDTPKAWLVTGGAGFIGGHLVEWLLGHGHTVRVLDDFSTGSRENLAAVQAIV